MATSLTRRDAERLVGAVRADLLAVTGTSESWCELGSHLLAARLVDTPDATLRMGETGDGHHWWVCVGDLRLDPTADQFAEYLWPLPLVCKDRHKRSSYQLREIHPVTAESMRCRLLALAADFDALRPWWLMTQRCRHHYNPLAAVSADAAELARSYAAPLA